MSVRCSACRAEITDDSRFCGYCGFRQQPISADDHRKLSDSYRALREETGEVGDRLTRELLTGEGRVSQLELAAARAAEQVPVVEAPQQGEVFALTRRKHSAPPELPPTLEVDAVLASSRAALVEAVPAAQDLQDKNRTRRFPLRVEVGYASDHNFYSGFMENLGAGGLFVATHLPIPIGESVEVTFTVPGLRRPCTALCEVCWQRDYNPQYPDMVPGMGLRFRQLDVEAQAAIDLFIRHRDPIFFDDE